MKAEIKNINGTRRLINIEVSAEELREKFDQVYQDIGKVARVPGFRPGHIPRDLLERYYETKARDEVVKRALPEYYLKAVEVENLTPVAAPEIENVQFKNHTLYFSAKVDVRPQLKLKTYKNLKITNKKIIVEQKQIDQTLERLQQMKAKEVTKEGKNEKEKIVPQLNDALAKEFGFSSLEDLKVSIHKDLQAHAELEVKADLERQIFEHLFKIATLDIPESLVARETKELLDQIKLNRILQGEKKEAIQSKEKELEEQARKEAIRRVKLSFILEEIANRENIQINEEDLDKRIEAISHRSGKDKVEVRQYLERQNLIPGLKAELRDKKTIEFLLTEAKVEEEK